MSDTCSAARATRKKIIDMVAAEVERVARDEGTWNDMSDDEKEKATKCYIGDCMQHLRNILIDAMASSAASMCLKTSFRTPWKRSQPTNGCQLNQCN